MQIRLLAPEASRNTDAGSAVTMRGTFSPGRGVERTFIFSMRTRPFLRYLLFALAVLQLAAYGATPVLEGMALARGADAPSALMAPGTGMAPASHDRASCPFCQLLDTAVRLPQAASVMPSPLRLGAVRPDRSDRLPAQRHGSHFYSRAPPPLAV